MPGRARKSGRKGNKKIDPIQFADIVGFVGVITSALIRKYIFLVF